MSTNDQERKAFESWTKINRPDLDLQFMYDKQGNYHHAGYIWGDANDAWQLWQAARRASQAQQPAPAESVKVPTTADEAALMCLLGERWLRDNAPERLRAAAVQLPVEPPEPLTDDEITDIWADVSARYEGAIDMHEFAREIEAKVLRGIGAVQPPVVPLTAARIEQLAITAGLYSGNPSTPGTGSIVLGRLRCFAELIEQDRGIGELERKRFYDALHHLHELFQRFDKP